MTGDYEHLPSGWREIAELLADIRDELRTMNGLNGPGQGLFGLPPAAQREEVS